MIGEIDREIFPLVHQDEAKCHKGFIAAETGFDEIGSPRAILPFR